MKKILLVIVSLFFIVGCSCAITNDAASATREYFNKFKMHDEGIIKELEDYVEKQDLTESQKETYQDVLKRQYKDMKYEIIDEKYDGDKATVKVKVTVYDLYKSQQDADKFLLDNREEFNDESGIHDAAKFLEYKLEQMKKQEETVDYTIDVKLEKNEKDNWEVQQLSEEDLEKIHGIYNYEN